MGYDIRAQDAADLGDGALRSHPGGPCWTCVPAASALRTARTVDAAWQLEVRCARGAAREADAIRQRFGAALLRADPGSLDVARAAKRRDIEQTEREEARAAAAQRVAASAGAGSLRQRLRGGFRRPRATRSTSGGPSCISWMLLMPRIGAPPAATVPL